MSRVRRTVGIDGVVAVAVVGDDDYLIIVAQCSFHRLVHADVDGCDCLLDGVIYARMPHHVAVGVIEDDAVVLLAVQCVSESDGHLRCGHHRLQVVGGYLRTRDKYPVLVLKLRFTAAREEERNVCELLRLGYTQLTQSGFRYNLAEGVRHVLFREEDVQPLETAVVRRHAVVLQVRDSLHAMLGHILLR